MSTVSTGLLYRTLANLRSAWRAISQSVRTGEAPLLSPDLPESDADALRMQMRQCLEGKGGEVSARARAAGLGHSYLNLNDKGRKRFLHILAKDFAVDRQELYAAARMVSETADLESALLTEERLRDVLTPPRLKLLTQFNSLPEGVKFLVDMRADLIRFGLDEPHLKSLERDLKGLLISWFDVGFLDLERITWGSPAALLEKLIAYEAVHEIRSWDDLKNRLAADRRCYAFFHPRMPDEPLIFVQVALVSGMSDNIQQLLDETVAPQDPMTADTAVFYSISNTQTGLQGVSFGNFLIKRVVDRLVQELPGIKTFVTLSPIPGFREYLESRWSGSFPEPPADTKHESQHWTTDTLRELQEKLGRPDWYRDPSVIGKVKEPLLRICAHYLVYERVRGRSVDSVANFHLSNGASVERINWLADISGKGMQQSFGLMVNYRYSVAEIETNHEAYRTNGEVATSSRVKRLLTPSG